MVKLYDHAVFYPMSKSQIKGKLATSHYHSVYNDTSDQMNIVHSMRNIKIIKFGHVIAHAASLSSFQSNYYIKTTDRK